MQDNQNGVKVVDQVLLLKNLNATGEAIVAQSVDSDESILYSDASGVLRYKNTNGDVSVTTSTTYPTIVTESTLSRTLALTDASKYIRLTNASSCTITVPPESSVAWVAGTSPSYTRGEAYTRMTTKALAANLSPTSIVLLFMQGESDAADDATNGNTVLVDLWTGKIEAMIDFLKADFGVTDVKVGLGIPHYASDASAGVQTSYDRLRTKILNWVALDPTNRVSVETSDIERPTGDVHMTAWQNAAVPGQLPVGQITFANRLVTAVSGFYS